MPPLLKKILAEYSATGLPPAYLPKNPRCRERRGIMNAKKLLSLWGLKWNPFSPELPSEALLVTAKIESFAWRVEQLVQEGGFALISGESGTGKSVALRIVAERLAALRDVVVGVVERPQSKTADFYRELGDIFSVKLSPSNRWGGFKALRERWKAHVASARIKPVLLIDEAQEMNSEVLAELRILASADFDATSLLTVVLCGDGRLLERLRQADLVPLGTRIRTRLLTEPASREELAELLRHALAKAGNATLMTTELQDTLVDHCAGNYRLLMTMGGELLAYGMAQEVAQLDEKFYLEVFHPQRPAGEEESEGLTMVSECNQPLPVVRVGEIPCEDQTQRWLVEQLWGDSSVGVIGGAPKCSKTWLGLDLALSVATGTACLGKYAVPRAGPVLVYLAEDALPVVRERVAGMARHRGLDLAGVEIHVITAPTLRLDRDPHRRRLLETAKRLRPRLLLLDPAGETSRHRREQRRRSGRAVGLLPLACSGSWTSRWCWCITPARTPRGESPPARDFAVPATCMPSATPTSTSAAAGSGWCCPASTAPRRPRRRSIWNWWRPTPRPPIWKSSRSWTASSGGTLQEQVLALLAAGVVQTRGKLRDALAVKNERLGEALESLEQAGRVRRTADRLATHRLNPRRAVPVPPIEIKRERNGPSSSLKLPSHRKEQIMPGIDFDRLRTQITMEQVLDLLGFKPCQRTGDQWYGALSPARIHAQSSSMLLRERGDRPLPLPSLPQPR